MSDYIPNQVLISGKFVEINKPKKCPCCHTVINAPIVASSELSNNNTFAVLFQCPSCDKYFFKSYTIRHIDSGYESEFFDSFPTVDLGLNIPDEIEKISPKFIEIYSQALTAEYHGLTEITGIGLRKSIEFLVKDYLVDINPETSEDIQGLFLGRAIEKIDNPKIKNLAKAAVWLGNDETHYLRIHEDKDIEDMKKFIKALLYFISLEAVVREASDFISFSIAK